MSPQDQGRYGGTPTAELERLARDPALPAPERDAISAELERRYADSLLDSHHPGPPPSATRPVPPPPHEPQQSHRRSRSQAGPPPYIPPRTPHPEPVSYPQQGPYAQTSPTADRPQPPGHHPGPAGRPKHRKRGLRFWGLVSLAVIVVLIAASVLSQAGKNQTYATECVTLVGTCAVEPGTFAGAPCSCVDAEGFTHVGTAR